MTRADGRRPAELRVLAIEPDYLENPHGSALITQGKTKVLCTAMVQEEVPRWPWAKGAAGSPRSTRSCPRRPATASSVRPRAASSGAHGRDPAADRTCSAGRRRLRALGERTLWLDCDVLRADGGTRCAAICGASSRPGARSTASASRGVRRLRRRGLGRRRRRRADARSRLLEDSNADTDMNVVMTGDGRLIEVQATAERDPFTRATLDELLALAEAGISEITEIQIEAAAVELP
jgi:ribonuclease PH